MSRLGVWWRRQRGTSTMVDLIEETQRWSMKTVEVIAETNPALARLTLEKIGARLDDLLAQAMTGEAARDMLVAVIDDVTAAAETEYARLGYGQRP